MKRRYAFLIWALLGLGTACLKDPEAPMNQPDTPTISVDEPSVARVSMLVKGSFGHKLEDITSYGVEFSDVLFEKDGTYTVLTPQEVTEDGFSLGITNLTPNKTYYLRSFISNGHSSLYSSVLTQKMPETSVASVSDVSLSADGNYLVAMIEDDGGRSVEDVGFVWGDTNDRRTLRREKRYPATIGLDGRTFTLPVSALGNKTRYVLAYAEDDKEATGFSRIALERFVAEPEPEPEPSPTQPYNEIWYTSADGEIVVPNKANVFGATLVSNTYNNGIGVFEFDAPVTMIGYHAFSGCKNLVEIHIPSLVTSIGEEAFASCISLNWPTIPESVTQIGNSAFYGCESFTVVGFPSTVTELGNSVFQYCQNLTSITGKWTSDDNKCLIIDGTLNSFAYANLGDSYSFPESVTTVGDSALRNCRYSGNLSFGSTLLRIESQAFAHAYYIKSIQLGESVEYIGDQAFNGFGVINLVLPASLKAIGSGALANWFQSVTLSAKTPPVAADAHIFETEYNTYDEFPVYVPAESVEAYKTAEYWSAYADRIQPIVEGQPTNEIWYTSSTGDIVEPAHSDVFNTRLVSNTYEDGKGVMVFEGTLTTIGGAAFWGCDFTSIQLPGALQTIDEQAFGACMHLETIDIPESVSSISEFRVFSQCPNLSSFTGKFATQDHRALIVGDTMVGFAPKGLTEYTVESGVKVIGAVFESCTNLSSINLPEGLEEIGAEAFEGCSALETIALPSTVKTIGFLAFSRSSLRTINIPESVVSISQDSFSSCTTLVSFTGKYASDDGHFLIINNELVGVALAGIEECNVPEGVVSTCNIWSLNNLKRITLPETITQISHIGYCLSLESIVIKAVTPPSFKNDGFSIFIETNNCPIYVPANSIEAYKSAEYWSEFADRIQAIQ
jgi:hypothetical protein